MYDNGIKHGCPLSPTMFGLIIDELETYLKNIEGVRLHVYLTWWLPFFFMLTILFCFLHQDQAYKDFGTSYMSFALFLALTTFPT